MMDMDLLDNGLGLGPIQRTMIQRNFVAESPSRGSANYHSTLDSPRVENLNAFEGLFLVKRRILKQEEQVALQNFC